MKSLRHYILVGDKKTWETSFLENTWGFSENTKGLWNTVQKNELLAFYVTSPIKKIIGCGIIDKKFKSEKLFWPDEKLFKKPLWKYRLKFNPLFVVKNWNDGITPPKGIMLNIGRRLVSESVFKNIVKEADVKWNSQIFSTIFNSKQ